MRWIFVGDIHGCLEELEDLLARVRPSEDDVVVAVGDMVRKGPDPAGCLDLWRARGYRSVLGNNEAALLRIAKEPVRRLFAPREDRAVLHRRDLLEWIATWPLYLDFPEIGVVALHGGVLPNGRQFAPALVPRDAALKLRRVRRTSNGTWRQVPRRDEQSSDPFWADLWDGDRVVVYGHTPRNETKENDHAIGLDTGCVYGGRLTAAVFEGAGRWELVDVPARKAYAA